MPLLPALAAGSMAAFYSFGGWWEATKIAEEVQNPERILPRALILGVTAVTVVYILVTRVFVYLVPVSQIASDETFMAQAGHRLFGAAGGHVMASLVVLCVLGSMAALRMLSPRVYHAMARDGLFFRAVTEAHPRYGTPALAIAIQAILASLLVVLGTFGQIVAHFVFVAVVFLGLSVAGTFLLDKPKGDGHLLRVPEYPYTPHAFLIMVAAMLFLLASGSPFQALLGVLVVLIGVPAFRLVHKYEVHGSGPNHLGMLRRRRALLRRIESRSLTNLQQRHVKHAVYFRLARAEGNLNRQRFRAIMGPIARLPAPRG
jgi:basic amino acid/polyamine antiporter, APA family